MDLKAIREMLRALKNRLQVSLNVMRDPSEKADALEFMQDVDRQIAAVNAEIEAQKADALVVVEIWGMANEYCECERCRMGRAAMNARDAIL